MVSRKQVTYVLIILLGLPILLHVYNPSMQLGGLGLLLGIIGYIVSPIVIFGSLLYFILKGWKK